MVDKVGQGRSGPERGGGGWDGRSSRLEGLSESEGGDKRVPGAGSGRSEGGQHKQRDASDKPADASQMKLQFAGIEMAPPLSKEEQEQQKQVVDEALRTGDYSKVPPAREPSVAVWKDESGKHFIVVPDESGRPVALPFRTGRKLDLQKDDPTKGGFIPVEEMIRNQPKPQSGPDLGQTIGNHVKNNWMPASGGSRGGSPSSVNNKVGNNTGGSGSSSQANNPSGQQQKPKGPSVGQQLMAQAQQSAIGMAQQVAGQMLGSALGGGGIGAGLSQGLGSMFSGQGLASMGLGGLMSMGTGALFSKAWAVDDSSSMAEQLAHKYAQEAVGELQGELQEMLMEKMFSSPAAEMVGPPDPNAPASPEGPKNLKEKLFGISAPAGFLMARATDKLDAAHPGACISTGSGSVIVDGQLAARMSDALICPKVEPGPVPHVGGFIAQGNPTVIVDHMLAARQDHMTVCTGCGMPGALKPIHAKEVHIGPKSTPPPEIKKKAGPSKDDAAAAKKAAEQKKAAEAKKQEEAKKKQEAEAKQKKEAEEKAKAEAERKKQTPRHGPTDDGEVEELGFPGTADVIGEAAGKPASDLQGKSKYGIGELSEKYGRAAAEAETEARIKGQYLDSFRERAEEAYAKYGEGSAEHIAAERNYRTLQSEVARASEEQGRYSQLADRARAADLLERAGNTLSTSMSVYEMLEAERTREERIAKYGYEEAFAQDMGTAFKATADGVLNAFPGLNKLGIPGAVAIPALAGELGSQAARVSTPTLNAAAEWLYSQSWWPRNRVPRSLLRARD